MQNALFVNQHKKGCFLNVSTDRLIKSGNVKFMKDVTRETILQNDQSDHLNAFEIKWETDEPLGDEAQQRQQEPMQQQIEDVKNEDVNTNADQQPNLEESSDPAAEIHSGLNPNVETEIDHSTVNHIPGTVVKLSSKELDRFKLDNPGTFLQAMPGTWRPSS